MTSPVLPHSILSDSAGPRTCLSCQKSFLYSSMDWHRLNVLLPLREEVYRNLSPISQLCILPSLRTHTHSLLAVHSYARLAGTLPVHKLLQQLPLSISQCQVPSQEFMLRARANTIVLDGFAPHTADNDLLGTPGLLMATSSWVFSRLIFARLCCHSRLPDQQSVNSRVRLTNAVWHRNLGLS